MDDFLLIDKPKGVSSHDVVDYIRKETGEKRVGHGGTLDPNATGLLIVGVGRAVTKKLGSISKDTRKTYIAEVILGEQRDTDDAEGRLVGPKNNRIPEISEIEKTLSSFIGESQQMPPSYSAIKIKGKKAYQMARKGQKVALEPRSVNIYSIKLLGYKYPRLSFECEVSSGTYIRSLARDIGMSLGAGGFLNNLRRTKIGNYDVTNARKVDIAPLKNKQFLGK